MTADAPDRLERLFRAARLHPSSERAAFLDAACPDDDALRAEVESLLALDAEAEADGFLDRPATGVLGDLPGPPAPAPDPLVGETVGPYRVLRTLGQGGMGAVYLAVREVPFVRHVALKVVRGLAAPDALARFEQERQILAGLDHPGIARLLDGGVTGAVPGAPGGLPYFAMEYVEGRPITDHCDRDRLGVEARLALFEQACGAVHYAHQNLVLHRDLKPSNILVTAGPDGAARVKLLDFGIAKLLSPTVGASRAPATETALRPLTPEYASPEQARGDALTTASDVYGLGVVLYELLAGERPYRVRGRTPEAVARAVAEADPEPPSARVAGGGAEETARRRDTTPEKLRRVLRGDLDTIALVALRKEPGRRYASAEALGQDVGRHLQGLPVEARGDSRAYRASTFVRRHLAATVAVAATVAAVLGFALYSQWQAGRLEAERDRAEAARAEAGAVAAFLVDLFERADPTATPGDSVTVRELLDDGAARVEGELAGQPAVQAAVLAAVARAVQNFGRPADALPLLERAAALRRDALGDDHPDTALSLLHLADALAQAHEVDRAETLYREHLAATDRAHGPGSPEAAAALARLVPLLAVQGRTEEEAPLARRWRATVDGLDDEGGAVLARSLTALGSYLALDRRFDDAEAYVRRAARVGARAEGDTSAVVAEAVLELAGIESRAGRPADAEASARHAAALHRALYPDGHEGLAVSLDTEAGAVLALGRPARAESLYREALAVRQRVHPGGSPTTARTHVRLGDLAAAGGRRGEAAEAYRAAIDEYAAALGPDVSVIRDVRSKLDAVEGR